MADFGRIPAKGTRWGQVPAFIFDLRDLKPGPKALYACLCSHADEKGHCWRSWGRLADQFGKSRKQIQRWFYDLEKAGLVTRIGWKGKVPLLLVIRVAAGCAWAQSRNLEQVIGRRQDSVPFGKEGARRRWEDETPASHQPDAHVPESQTPMSPQHNLPNKTSLTKEEARQVGEVCGDSANQKRLYGLKWGNPSLKGEAVQGALNRLADQIGWERADEMGKPALAARLAAENPGVFTVAEALAVLSPQLRG